MDKDHDVHDVIPEKQLGLHNVSSYLDSCLQKAEDEITSGASSTTLESGTLGPTRVTFDVNGSVGVLLVEPDRLGVSSHSNFSSVRGNTCVYKGKYAYELMLGSKGVMQLGWCTISCKFSQEEGVGDTENSYAYDGSRLRKWNVRTVKYGEPWLTGDIITCTLDCDNGVITFYRNGSCMGDAFTNVKLGPGMAYFPAVSLSFGEILRANFGATPLRYPVKGFQPMQGPPLLDLAKAQHLFIYLERLLLALNDVDEGIGRCADTSLSSPRVGLTQQHERSARSSLLLITAHLFDKLAPLLVNAYIVESCLLPFLQSLCNMKNPLHQPLVTKTMQILWMFMQEFELKACLENLILSLQSVYRFSVVSVDFTEQQQYLSITLAMLQHGPTRKFLLKNTFFDKVNLPVFMHVKPPDDSGLLQLIPTVWWSSPSKKKESTEELTAEEQEKKEKYYSSCKSLGEKVAVLEEIQVEILKLLLIDSDNSDGTSSRSLFLQRFREFLKENNAQIGNRVLTNKCPLPLALCFFHRLVRALRHYWSEFAVNNPDVAVPSSDAFVPCVRFLDDTIDYFDLQRIGGLMSHLRKTYKDDIAKLTAKTPSQTEGARAKLTKEEETEKLLEKLRVIEPARRHDDQVPTSKDHASAMSLVELLDGIIVLYIITAHKQLSKMSTLRDMLNEYVTALEETEKKQSECPAELIEVCEELDRAHSVFQEKVTEQARHISWVIAVTYAKDKQDDVHWLLKAILTSIENASRQEHLFSFLPEFYIDAAISTSVSLKSYFPPTLPFDTLEESTASIHRLALFFSQHFADPRIVNSDAKDTIVQALACFVCYPVSLKALEDMPLDKRQNMVKCLLAPYEKRSWAHTNWVLVRLWKGCGFAFRYTHLPHLLPTKNQQQEIASASLQTPCPSLVFQQHIKEFLLSSQDGATKLIDSLLNQLNWAFSEFVGMLQELQQVSTRPQATYVDSRVFKICATCFDISVGLLRVLEMITCIVPELLTDWSKPSAEVLLARLFQLLTQVLNRITAKTGLFENIVSQALPDLETVDYFSILTAVTGILVNLLLKGNSSSVECSTAAMFAEPGFQESSLEFLLGGSTGDEAAAAPKSKAIFSFNKYKGKEVSEAEVEEVNTLISYLRVQGHKNKAHSPDIAEDQLCGICYARPKTALFKPCGHQSCKSCISHQLMTKKECFFCRVAVEEVVDYKGTPFKFS